MKEKIKELCILDLNPAEIKKFLLLGKSYCNFDLPPYFTFDALIKEIADKLESKSLSDFYSSKGKPENFEGVNYKLLTNKDGKYAWRQFELIHPALYVSLVFKIMNSWDFIREKIGSFRLNSKIHCMSLPINTVEKEHPNKSAILNWWDNVEQRSIELAMDYQYLIQTDITDCYGSIYTHSLAWALHGREVSKEKDFRNDKTAIGNVIDKHLQQMAYGQTNGIPQGSELMNLIAEMLLGYADALLSEKIPSRILDYQIIRYRDDYRVFANSVQDAEEIIKCIAQVVHSLGMKLHPQKTLASGDVVRDSLKVDKRYWICHRRKGASLQKDLLIIHDLAEKYPNSGSLVRALNEFLTRITSIRRIRENILVLISILVDIAFRNPRTYPVGSAILSKLIDSLDKNEEKIKILNTIQKRFEKVPNIGHLDIWLQRIRYKIDSSLEYEEPLCGIVSGKDIQLWNSDWLVGEIKSLIDAQKIVDRKELDRMPAVVAQDEVNFFMKDYS